MRVRLAAALTLIALATVACGAGSTAKPGPPGVSSAVTGELTRTASAALAVTTGKPLIDPAELRDGAGYDAIPSVDDPVVVERATADAALDPTEQVMLVTHGGKARAYPVRSLIRHEIVNDVLGGRPVAVTWCPLCNTGIAFDRRVAGHTETFGVSGQLYRSALVMFDRRTDSLWSQPRGTAVLGPLTGTELEVVPAQLVPWSQARETPGITVALGDRAELDRASNPYTGYDTSDQPFLFEGTVDDRLPPVERVVGLESGGRAQAVSFGLLRQRRTVEVTLGGQPVVLLWAAGSNSPLETSDVRTGRDVGASGAYDPRLDGRTLHLEAGGDLTAAGPTTFTDRETASTWSLTGAAVAGPLKGRQLTAVAHQDAFWFAWAAFHPETSLRVG